MTSSSANGESFDIVRYLPEIAQITDPQLRETVVAIWNELWEKSQWARLEDLKVSPEINRPAMPHNRAIVRMALAVADTFEEFHGVHMDRDILIAAAVLQDASKVVETDPTADLAAEFNELGSTFPHAFWVTHVALNHGLPHEICEILLNHTPQSATFPKTLIGKVLYYVDQLDVIAIYQDRWKKQLTITK